MASEPEQNSPPAKPTSATEGPNHDPDNLSDLDSDLDDANDPTLAHLQSTRLAELQSAAAARATATTSSPFSHLQPYSSEKAAMHTIAAAPLAVLIFSHPDFPLCKTMAQHLNRIAGLTAHAGASDSNDDVDNVVWIELEAEKASFLTERLRVRVLPAVVGYKRGEECGRLVGFEGLGKRAARDGGWREVIGVFREWGLVGRGKVMGEEDDGSESEDEGDDEDREQGEGSWIGGKKSNSRFSTRGVGKGADDDDDDWD